MFLLPTPRHVSRTDGFSPWSADNALIAADSALENLAPALERFLEEAAVLTRCRWRRENGETKKLAGSSHTLAADDPNLEPEAYRLTLGPEGIRIFCREWRGAFYALQTLRQVMVQFPEAYPHLSVEDGPILRHRGYLLDISRTRVPTMATLRTLIDRLAALKYNQLQLYTEHTFAFPGHETVWGEASPLTAEDVRALDVYAAERAIELVPNFNSFGHFERWLRHPEYHRFAECPYGWRRPDGHGMPWGSTLAPTAESRQFLGSLFREMLPQFSSRLCNLGGDEPWELGMGRSRQRCAEQGKHLVYLDFLHQIVEEASAHKERVQFWADIVLERPEVVPNLDPRLTALVWGYEADHPLESQGARFAAAGLPLYLCPGTSTWNSLGTRLDNARANIAAAGKAAAKNGADGFLLTDWGDYGHHQPPVVSAPPIVAGAQAAWAPERTLTTEEWVAGIERLGLPTGAAALAPLLLRLGSLGQLFAHRPANRMPLASLISAPEDRVRALASEPRTEELQRCAHELAELAEGLAAVSVEGAEAEEARAALSISVGLLQFASLRARRHRSLPHPAAPAQLRRDLRALIGRFEENWIVGHRVGGLAESTSWLRTALDSLPTDPPARPAWPPTAWG